MIQGTGSTQRSGLPDPISNSLRALLFADHPPPLEPSVSFIHVLHADCELRSECRDSLCLGSFIYEQLLTLFSWRSNLVSAFLMFLLSQSIRGFKGDSRNKSFLLQGQKKERGDSYLRVHWGIYSFVSVLSLLLLTEAWTHLFSLTDSGGAERDVCKYSITFLSDIKRKHSNISVLQLFNIFHILHRIISPVCSIIPNIHISVSS